MTLHSDNDNHCHQIYSQFGVIVNKKMVSKICGKSKFTLKLESAAVSQNGKKYTTLDELKGMKRLFSLIHAHITSNMLRYQNGFAASLTSYIRKL
jgi:hypothetical protein